MRDVLVCGLCPLPFENTRRSYGPGIRTWQMALGLARAGIRVALLAGKIPDAYDDDSEAVPEELRDEVRIERLDLAELLNPAVVRERLDRLAPEAVVGATVYGSSALAAAEPEVPFWADQFGHYMAEAQAKARLDGVNRTVAQFWDRLEPVLQAADKISVVSRRQRYAAIGELGGIGRLRAETCGYEFTAVIPCALVPTAAIPSRPASAAERSTPEDAFVVFWSGGYNVWSDVETLFRALELAMERDPRIHFLSTGGVIGGHDETTYRRFEEQVAGSPFRDRFHLRGWVPAELLPTLQAEADLGVLTEIPIYEGELGHKNRIVQWMGAGLPVAYNRIGDLGDLIAEEDLGLSFAVGDHVGLAETIHWAATHPVEMREKAARARDYARRELSFEATTRELVAWAREPGRAPDAGSVDRLGAGRRVDHRADDAELERRLAAVESRHRETLAELEKIHTSKTWRLWMLYLAVRRFPARVLERLFGGSDPESNRG